MKKLLLALLGVLIALPALAYSFSYEYEGQTIKYDIVSNDEKTVWTAQGYGSTPGNSVSGDVIIPEKVIYKGEEYTVIGIGSRSFYKSQVTSITLPSTITTIYKDAFRESAQLASVSLPEGLTTIGANAFYMCSVLTDLRLPQTLTTLGDYAFYYCSSLSTQTLPQNLTTLGKGAFHGCSSFSEVKIPSSWNSIPEDTFSGCSSLTKVELPETITSIGGYAFDCCTSLASIDLPERLLTIDNYAFSSCRSLVSLSLPKTLTSIGNYAFKNCTALESVGPKAGGIYPDGTSLAIGDNAFESCSALKTVVLPESTVSLGEHSFNRCTNLIGVALSPNLTSVGNYAFYQCDQLGSIILPPSLSTIGTYAFTVKRVALPNGMNYWSYTGIYAYKYNYDPDECSVIGFDLYTRDGKKLLFANSEPELTIRPAVEKVAANAFRECTATTIKVENGPAPLVFEDGAFNTTNISTLILNRNYVSSEVPVPAITTIDFGTLGNIECKDMAFSWPGVSTLTFHEGLQSIGTEAFKNWTSFTALDLPQSLRAIGAGAFSGCSQITHLELPAQLMSVGAGAFAGCPAIESVTPKGDNACTLSPSAFDINVFNTAQVALPSSANILSYRDAATNWPLFLHMTDDGTAGERYEYEGLLYRIIGEDAVEVVNSESYAELTEVEIPEGITRYVPESDNSGGMSGVLHRYRVVGIAPDAFAGLTALKSVTLSDAVEEIGANAFKGCTALTTVKFGANLRDIKASAFESCSKLTKVDFSATRLEAIGDAAFYNTILNSFIPAATLRSIGANAFNKTRLTALDLSGNAALEYIGASAFADCRALTSISQPPLDGALRYIADRAFMGNIRFTSEIVLPDSLEYLGSHAFDNARNTTRVELPANGKLTVGNAAFKDCQRLVSVTTRGDKNNVAIGDSAFIACSAMKTIDIRFNEVGAYAFKDNTALTELSLYGTGRLHPHALDYCSSLTGAKLNMGIISTGVAEEGCTALASVDLSDNVRVIETKAFYNHSTITDIKFGPELEHVQSNAFDGPKPKEVRFAYADEPKAVTVVEKDAFGKEESISYLSLGNRMKSFSWNCNNYLDSCDLGTTVQAFPVNMPIPKSGHMIIPGTVEGTVTFRADYYTSWASYGSATITFAYSPTPLTVKRGTSIRYNYPTCNQICKTIEVDRVLEGNRAITSPNLVIADNPEHRLDINLNWYLKFETTFSNHTTINTLHVGSSARWLAYTTDIPFDQVTFSEGVEEIYNLHACNKAIRYPGSLKKITNLILNSESISFAESCDSLEIVGRTIKNAGLKEVYIGRTITGVENLFEGMTQLKKAVIGNGTDTIHSPVTSLPKGIFKNCTALENVILTDEIHTINAEAFDGCSNMKIVSFPENLKVIGEYAYRGCTGLDRIVARNRVPIDGVTGFDADVENNVPLYVPDGTEDDYYWSNTFGLFNINPHTGNVISEVKVEDPEKLDELDDLEEGSEYQLSDVPVTVLLFDGVEEVPDPGIEMESARRRAATDGTSPAYGEDTPIYWFSPNPEVLSIDENNVLTVLKDEPAEIWAIALDGSDKKAVIGVNNFLLGDLTGDKVLNSSDVNSMAGHISLPEGSTIRLKVADMNGDDTIDSADLNILIQTISKN